jgi:hypothetical protein
LTPAAKFATGMVSLMLVVHLHMRISPQIVEKIRNAPNLISGAFWEDDL